MEAKFYALFGVLLNSWFLNELLLFLIVMPLVLLNWELMNID